MERRDVAFDSNGVTLRGHLRVPAAAAASSPAIVMAHGFTGVKEFCDAFAEAFAAAGFATLTFDHPNFGESEGSPRQEVDLQAQTDAYRDAVTWCRARPEIDRDRIALWGTSLSGGVVLMAAAFDRRIRAVVSQVPFISGADTFTRSLAGHSIVAMRALFSQDRDGRLRGEPPMVMPVASPDASEPCATPGEQSWRWLSAMAIEAPTWRNEVTLRSIENLSEYEPGFFIRRIAPTPLLMLVATDDALTAAQTALDAYARALEPKRLVLHRGEHYDLYAGGGFAKAAAATIEFFNETLKGEDLN